MSKNAEEFLDKNMSTLVKYRKMLRWYYANTRFI
jgi:hypothetical protein